jgi:hypothetical protein
MIITQVIIIIIIIQLNSRDRIIIIIICSLFNDAVCVLVYFLFRMSSKQFYLYTKLSSVPTQTAWETMRGIVQIVVTITNIKFNKNPFSSSETVTCGQTDMAKQVSAYAANFCFRMHQKLKTYSKLE